MNNNNITDLIKDITIESWNNKEFKNNLLINPKETIENFTNKMVRFKKNIKLHVEDQADERFIYLNIPRELDLDNVELSQEELELVSGGSTFACGVLGGLAAYAIIEAVEGTYEAIKDRLK